MPRFHRGRRRRGHRCIDVGGRRPAVERPPRPRPGGGGRRVAAAAVRRDDPGTVAGGRLVGAGAAEHPGVRRCSGCCSGGARGTPAVPSRGPVPTRATSWRGSWPRGRTPAARRRRRPCRPSWPTSRWPPDDRPLVGATVRPAVDTAWRRTSYSSLSAAAAEPAQPGVGSEPEERPKEDEPELAALAERGHRTRRRPTRRAVADGRRCRSGRPSARWCTRCWSTPTRRRPTCARSCSARIARAAGPVAGRRRPGGARRRAGAGVRHARSGRWPAARRCATSRCATGSARWSSSCRCPAATCAATRPRAVTLGDVAPLLRAHLPAGDPLLPYADALAGPALGGQDLRGYLTGSVDVVLRVRTATRAATWSSTTRPTGSAGSPARAGRR